MVRYRGKDKRAGADVVIDDAAGAQPQGGEDVQVEAPEQPQSPFILMVLVGWKRFEKVVY